MRVGGTLSAVMVLPDGNTIDWVGSTPKWCTQVVHPEHLCFTLSDAPGEPAGTPIVTTFTEVGGNEGNGGTEVSLTQSSPEFSDEQVEATVEGYNSFYDSLERVLASLK